MWSSQLLPDNRNLPRGHFSDSAPHQHLPITLTLVNKTKPRLKLSSTYPQPKTQNQSLNTLNQNQEVRQNKSLILGFRLWVSGAEF